MKEALNPMSYRMRSHVQVSPATLLAVVTVGVALTGVAVVLAAGRAAGTLPGVPEPERLLHVQEVDANGQVWPRGSSALWRAIQDIPDVDVAAVRYLQAHLRADGTTMIVSAAGVSDGFFETMAAQPALGRTPRHARDGGDEVVVSQALWQQLAIDPFVPTTVLLDGIAHTIVGVMPEGFDMPGGRDLWIDRKSVV